MTLKEFQEKTAFLGWEHVKEEDMPSIGKMSGYGAIDTGYWAPGKAELNYWYNTKTVAMNNDRTWVEVPLEAIDQVDKQLAYSYAKGNIVATFSVRWTLNGYDGAITFYPIGM